MLRHDRSGPRDAPAVLLLHGWPGDRHDHDAVAALLADDHHVLQPDLAGFGESRGDGVTTPDDVGAAAQVRALTELLDDAGVGEVVVAGYDVGSVVAQTLTREHPDRVRGLVLAPPIPGVGTRVLEPERVAEFWYQSFHQFDLAERLLDGDPAAVRTYLAHFWTHWSGAGWTPSREHLDRLAQVYGAAGAFTSSIGWYRAGSGTLARSVAEEPPAPEQRIAVPTRVLWPREDPLFPPAWADRAGEWFADVRVSEVDGGHFVPLEAPESMAEAVRLLARG